MYPDSIEMLVLSIMESHHTMQRGYWYGYDRIIADIREKASMIVPEHEVRAALKELCKQGKVYVDTIYDEATGKLNGKGYFYNPGARQL